MYLRRQHNQRNAFTLTEILVAIGLLMIIMVSVSTVFRATSDTVNGGIATCDLNRRMASAQSTLQTDFIGTTNDAYSGTGGMWTTNTPGTPFLVIRGQQRLAYLNRDAWNAAGGVAAADIPDNRFRTDIISFFARGTYKRQTGGGPAKTQAIANMLPVTDAMITYGQLMLPTNSAGINPLPSTFTFLAPGDGANPGANPNNYFANQWILGRSCILLPTNTFNNGMGNLSALIDLDGTPLYYYGRTAALPSVAPWNIEPLAEGSRATYGGTNPPTADPATNLIQSSRYDVASIPPGTTWAAYATEVGSFATAHPGPGPASWYNYFGYRFWAVPSPDVVWSDTGLSTALKQNLFADLMARSAPIFLKSTCNFTVEFAGDYCAQNPANGLVTTGKGISFNPLVSTTWNLDGEIDYDIDNGLHKIRWYGLSNPIGNLADLRYRNPLTIPFEHSIAPTSPVNSEYVWAWSPNELICTDASVPVTTTLAPKLIRITVQILDPQGHVVNGMTRQFVFPVR